MQFVTDHEFMEKLTPSFDLLGSDGGLFEWPWRELAAKPGGQRDADAACARRLGLSIGLSVIAPRKAPGRKRGR